MQVREALPADAAAACIVLKRSIAELCIADHRNDPSILARWLGNKTHENFCAWVNQPDNSVLVAIEDQDILAVGSVTDAGTIGLDYVSPDARFRGVSRALLPALEERAGERGNHRCNLTSTETGMTNSPQTTLPSSSSQPFGFGYALMSPRLVRSLLVWQLPLNHFSALPPA